MQSPYGLSRPRFAVATRRRLCGRVEQIYRNKTTAGAVVEVIEF
jgi:hypothetical protein